MNKKRTGKGQKENGDAGTRSHPRPPSSPSFWRSFRRAWRSSLRHVKLLVGVPRLVLPRNHAEVRPDVTGMFEVVGASSDGGDDHGQADDADAVDDHAPCASGSFVITQIFEDLVPLYLATCFASSASPAATAFGSSPYRVTLASDDTPRTCQNRLREPFPYLSRTGGRRGRACGAAPTVRSARARCCGL